MRGEEKPVQTLFFAIFFVSFSALAPHAAAQGRPSQRTIEECYSLREANRPQEAVGCFRALYQQERSRAALVNLGVAEAAIELYVEAEEHIVLALSDHQDPWISERREAIEGTLRAVREHLGTLTIEGGAEGTPIYLDGELRGTLPIPPIRALVGSHRVEARMGAERIAQQVDVTADETVVVAISSPTSEPDPALAENEDVPTPPQLAGIALAAVGGAAVVTGAIVGGLALGEQGSVHERCPNMRCESQTALDQANHMTTLAAAADGLLFGGGLVAAVGVVLAIVGADGSESAPQASLQCSGEGCVGSLRGRF